MSNLKELWDTEPAAVIAVVTAVLDVFVLLVPQFTPEVEAAIVAVLTALSGLALRSQVWPTVHVEREVVKAKAEVLDHLGGGGDAL